MKDIAGIRKLITYNSSVAAATQSDAWTSLARLPARTPLRSSYTRCWPRSPFHPGRAQPTVPSPALPLYSSAENSLLNVKLLMVMVVVAAGLASVMVTGKGGVCSPTLQWHWFSPPLLGHLLQCSLVHRFANAVEDGTSCGGSGLQLCLAGVCEVCPCCYWLSVSVRFVIFV